MKQTIQPNPNIFEKIFIETSLSIHNDSQQQQKLNNSEELDNSYSKAKGVNNSQASIDNHLVNNSFSVINEAEQYILDELNEIIQKNGNLKPITNDSQLRRNCINTINQYNILTKQEQDQNIQSQQLTNLNKFQGGKACSWCSRMIQSHIQNQIISQHSIITEFQHQLEYLNNLVLSYRQQLREQEDKANKKFNQFYNQNKLLKQNIDDLLLKIQQSKNIEVQKQKSIVLLTQQITKLKSQLNKYAIRPSHDSIDSRKSKSIISKSVIQNRPDYKPLNTKRTMAENSKEEFPSSVRQELEKMIQVLLIEVQYQRKLNQKMKNQLKILSHELGQKQKIERKKNQQIYKLQLNLIKAKQQALNSQNSMKISDYYRRQTILESQIDQRSDQILLADIITKKKEVTHLEKFKIAIKIIQIYQEKIDQKSYQMLIPEDLIIYYRKGNVQKIFVREYGKQSRVRKSQIQTYSKQQLLVENLLYNVAFFLQQLFKMSEDKKTYSLIDIIQNTIKQKISQILDDKVGRKFIFLEELKKIIKSSISVKDKQIQFFQ